MIAREGRSILLALGIPAVLFLVLGFAGRVWAWPPGALLSVLFAFSLFFFRDPARTGPRGDGLVVSAGDGRVIAADRVHEPHFLRGEARRVSVFLSLFDVHVNRFPVGGTVELLERRSGGFVPAWREAAGAGNARVSVGIRTPAGHPVLVRQVAGLVARRIVNHATEGESVARGDRMGIIRFGSRIDLFLPGEATVLVAPGDRAIGGVTAVARLPAAAVRAAPAAPEVESEDGR